MILGPLRFLKKELYYHLMFWATIVVEIVMFTYSLNAQVVWNTLLLLRLPRLFSYFNQPIKAVIQGAQTFFPFVPVLLSFLFLYSYVGQFVFGGLLYVGNPLLVGTAYSGANYYYYNFNDVGSSIVTLFNLFIVNNWNILASGTDRVAGRASRIYLVVFWAVAILTLLNVFFSFIFSIVDSNKEAQLQEERDKADRAKKRASQHVHGSDWWHDDDDDDGKKEVQMITINDGEVVTGNIEDDIENALFMENLFVFGGMAGFQSQTNNTIPDERTPTMKLKRGDSQIFEKDDDAKLGADSALQAALQKNDN